MIKQDLKQTEFNEYYSGYLNKLPDTISLIKGYEQGKKDVIDFFTSIPEEKLTYRYLPEKWSIKEVFQHLIDTERVFMYRCFRIARKDATPLSGFDQDTYITPSRADYKSLDQLIKEFEINRNNSISLLQSLSDEDLQFIGNSNGGAMSARAAAFIVLGHDIWHVDIVKERYL